MVSTLDSESSDPSSNLGGIYPFAASNWFHGVMASTLDSESSDPSSNLVQMCLTIQQVPWCNGFHGVMVSTLDFESSDPSSNLGGT
uniref:Uncharacterized protein n=1 Tax=Vespula pensylvanica TaxID=30213 RepID=A0A834NRP5_VESPE|nr:hypothetical protein H0235_011228 [Vespula pensylvanica]